MANKFTISESGGELGELDRDQTQENGLKTSARELVRRAYRQILGREVEGAGLEVYTQVLTSGAISVRDLVKQSLRSEEWKGRFIQGKNAPEILMALYGCAFARAPDREAWDQFVIQGGANDWDAVIQQMVDSPEYTRRFGADKVPDDRERYHADSRRSRGLNIYDPLFESQAKEIGLEVRPISAFEQPAKSVYDLYLNDPVLQRFFPLALLPAGQLDFLGWLTTFGRSLHGLGDVEILWFLQESAEDLPRGLALTYLINPTWQEEFPLALTSHGWQDFTHWIENNFSPFFAETALGNTPPAISAGKQCPSGPQLRQSARVESAEVEGVNILSHFCYPSGIRQAALWTQASLERAGVSTSCRDIPVAAPTREGERTDRLGLEIYPITLLTNAPIPYFMNAYERAGLFRQSQVYRIAYWYWELQTIPEEWVPIGSMVDEIWAPTEFVANAMRSRMPVPVHKMPPGVGIDSVESVPRAMFGIPEDHCVFLFMFDINSQMERKNPRGVIRAFRRAFGREDKATLVIKTSGGGDSPNLEALRKEAPQANIVFIDKLFSRAATNGMIEMSDCFISLHRSEGFGLGLAEAMLLGRPVIATGYSGNLDFMNEGNSLLVNYRLTEITEDNAIYRKGNFWAEPSIDQAAFYLRWVFENRLAAAELGARSRSDTLRTLSLEAAGRRMLQRIAEISQRD